MAAVAKSVVTTDLTIELALSLIATPKSKPDEPKDTSKGKPPSVVKGGVEPGSEPPPPKAVAPDTALEGLANDEVFHTLQNVYENRREELLDLTRKLAGSFGMTLVSSDAVNEALGLSETAAAA